MVLAIIYLVYSHLGSKSPDPQTAVSQSMQEANAVDPSAHPASSQPQSTGLRAPLDRTREVLDQARKQNAPGQY